MCYLLFEEGCRMFTASWDPITTAALQRGRDPTVPAPATVELHTRQQDGDAHLRRGNSSAEHCPNAVEWQRVSS